MILHIKLKLNFDILNTNILNTMDIYITVAVICNSQPLIF